VRGRNSPPCDFYERDSAEESDTDGDAAEPKFQWPAAAEDSNFANLKTEDSSEERMAKLVRPNRQIHADDRPDRQIDNQFHEGAPSRNGVVK
jgi:hypothetical protein